MSLFKRKTFHEKRVSLLEKQILTAMKKSGREFRGGYIRLALNQLSWVERLEAELEGLQRNAD